MSTRSAIVVGGGIGGLATAIALLGRGWQVQVLERAPEFAEVGAGISLWSNALNALDAIGVGAAVRGLGVVEVQGGIRTSAGRWLSRSDPEELERYGSVTMLHRADLLRVLLEAVTPASLLAATEALSIVESTDSVAVTHSGGTLSADLVVGADGLRSTVRTIAWPAARPPHYAGYTAWRVVTPSVAIDGDRGGEIWGQGARFGFAGLPDGRIYCYATANTVAGGTSPRGELAQLRQLFGSWPDPIPALLESADPDQVLRHDIYDLPDPGSYVRGRVALLGDAAHAMTPNLGQGAGQALEDAATLAAVLDEHAAVPAALARYDQVRHRRTQGLVKRSRQMGAVGQWSWRPAVLARDLLLPLVPTSLVMRSLASTLTWPPPGGVTTV